MAKIKGIFKRRYSLDTIIDGSLTLNNESRTLEKNGVKLDLTGKKYELLLLLMENAIKYGDGHSIEIEISEEEGYRLVSVKNSGCTLSDMELPHIFDSFWRGSNSQNVPGSGLGLSICRRLANKIGGEIFAETDEEWFQVTVLFCMAGISI